MKKLIALLITSILSCTSINESPTIAKANELSGGQVAPSTEYKLRIPTVIDDILEAVNLSNS